VIAQIFEALAGQPIDMAILPINGCNFFHEQHQIVGKL
jgi:hypothetical protein